MLIHFAGQMPHFNYTSALSLIYMKSFIFTEIMSAITVHRNSLA